MSKASLMIITVPDDETAHRIAERLVEDNLAAGVQISAINSVYRWQGKIEREGERVLTVKTVDTRFAEIEAVVDALHPYDVPPLIQLPIERGKQSYLDWIVANTKD